MKILSDRPRLPSTNLVLVDDVAIRTSHLKVVRRSSAIQDSSDQPLDTTPSLGITSSIFMIYLKNARVSYPTDYAPSPKSLNYLFVTQPVIPFHIIKHFLSVIYVELLRILFLVLSPVFSFMFPVFAVLFCIKVRIFPKDSSTMLLSISKSPILVLCIPLSALSQFLFPVLPMVISGFGTNLVSVFLVVFSAGQQITSPLRGI